MATNVLIDSSIISKWYKELYGDYLLFDDLKSEGLVFTPKSCSHNWKEYIGFTDRYNYCETCGIKNVQEKDSK